MSNLEKISEHLVCFRDSSNVYAILDGVAALLVDAGSGAVVESLRKGGTREIEWILHTHHQGSHCRWLHGNDARYTIE